MSMLVLLTEKIADDSYVHMDVLNLIQQFVRIEGIDFQGLKCESFQIWEKANIMIYSTSDKKNKILKKILEKQAEEKKNYLHEYHFTSCLISLTTNLDEYFKSEINLDLIDENFQIITDII